MKLIYLAMMSIMFAFLLGGYILFLSVFLDAYSSEDKTAIIKINEVHEADVELGLLIFGTGIIILGIPIFFKMVRRTYDTLQKI
jgi:uncharacterized membrane protein YedE/YeeE